MPEELLTGWGRVAPSRSTVETPRDAAAVVAAVLAERGGARGVVARGLGRSYGDAAQNSGGTVLDLTGMDRVHDLDLAAGTVTADAGLSLDRLMRLALPFGFFVPVTPGTRYVTLGGALAGDIHGKNHHVEGSFATHVLSFDLVTGAGEVRTVSPADDPETFWATAGGMGLTGVVTRLTLRLLPVQTSLMRVDTERAANLDDVMARMEARDDDYRYSVAWIDSLAQGPTMGRAVLTRGDHATLDELPVTKRRDPLRYGPTPRLVAPPVFPNGLLRRATVRAFNEVWFRKAPRQHTGLESIPTFFHPLDGVLEWNRVYGPQGFIQYQFLVPFGAEDALRSAVRQLTDAQCPSFLTVLKRFGAANPGPLSFPQPGWTLTLDVPARMPGLGALCDRLDELVVGAGGRVYLSKDSRLRPDLLGAMYPRLDEWRETRAKLDPAGVFASDLGRRVGLL